MAVLPEVCVCVLCEREKDFFGHECVFVIDAQWNGVVAWRGKKERRDWSGKEERKGARARARARERRCDADRQK